MESPRTGKEKGSGGRKKGQEPFWLTGQFYAFPKLPIRLLTLFLLLGVVGRVVSDGHPYPIRRLL